MYIITLISDNFYQIILGINNSYFLIIGIADAYIIDGLKILCQKTLIKHINIENSCDLLIYS